MTPPWRRKGFEADFALCFAVVPQKNLLQDQDMLLQLDSEADLVLSEFDAALPGFLHQD